MKIHKGDQVMIISGKDRTKRGRALQVFPKKQKVLVEGLNLRKNRSKPKKAGEKGEMVLSPSPLAISNVKLICSKCGQPTRVGYKLVEKKKYRMCKKCGQEV